MKRLMTLLCVICIQFANSYSQNNVQYQEMTEKEGLCYFLKIYNRNPDENSYTRKIDNTFRKYSYGFPNTYTKNYLERTDNYNYNQNKNDEFKYADMLNDASLDLNYTIKTLSFNKMYSAIFTSELGEYDFNANAFPVNFDIKKTKSLFSRRVSENMTSSFVTIRKLSNYDQFETFNKYELKLNISTTDASKFIDNRKNKTNGYVDREVFLRIIYTVENTQVSDKYIIHPYDYCSGLAINATKIEVWTDKYCTYQKLGEISLNKSIMNTNSIESNEQIYSSPEIYEKTEVMPSYKDGVDELFNFISQNLKYPYLAKENKLEGKVIVKFYVDEFGKIRNPIIIRDGVGGGASEEALRIINEMPLWIPGMQNWKKVKVYYVLPIAFYLD